MRPIIPAPTDAVCTCVNRSFEDAFTIAMSSIPTNCLDVSCEEFGQSDTMTARDELQGAVTHLRV